MRVLIFKKATLIRIAAFAIILAGAVVYTRVVVNNEQEVFAQDSVVTSLATESKEVAITIDTTFGEDVTYELLDVLDAHGAKATFAVMGLWAKENPELVKEIVASGHEVISHSMTHEKYDELGPELAVKDAQAAREMLLADFGVETNYIRLPYGNGNDETVAALEDAGFTVVKWSVDSRDWSGKDAQTIAKNVTEKLEPGAIVLFQNNVDASVEALDLVLEALADRAYTTVGIATLAG